MCAQREGNLRRHDTLEGVQPASRSPSRRTSGAGRAASPPKYSATANAAKTKPKTTAAASGSASTKQRPPTTQQRP
eukprot:7854071-Alexandrium_andersonii.AAC.1